MAKVETRKLEIWRKTPAPARKSYLDDKNYKATVCLARYELLCRCPQLLCGLESDLISNVFLTVDTHWNSAGEIYRVCSSRSLNDNTPSLANYVISLADLCAAFRAYATELPRQIDLTPGFCGIPSYGDCFFEEELADIILRKPDAFIAYASTGKDLPSYLNPLLQQRYLVVKRQIEYTCINETVMDRPYNDSYLKHMNSVIKQSVELELEHACSQFEPVFERLPRSELTVFPNFMGDYSYQSSRTLKYLYKPDGYTSKSGVRLGLTSANASDNYTFMRSDPAGGMVLNGNIFFITEDQHISGAVGTKQHVMKLTLDIPSDDEYKDVQCGIIMESEDQIKSSRAKHLILTPDNIEEELQNYKNNGDDLFRLFKHALIFCNIVDTFDPITSIRNFTGEYRPLLRFRLRNDGPSRAGFASSSCVSALLLNVLYRASGQTYYTAHGSPQSREILSSLVWIFENELGLRSGIQDIDGSVNGGLNHTHYLAVNDTTRLRITRTPVEVSDLPHYIMLLDTKIPRSSTLDVRRGLNLRHLGYLTRAPQVMAAITESLLIHRHILDSIKNGWWPDVGPLMEKYMELRQVIDPTAVCTTFDKSQPQSDKKPILLQAFDFLKNKCGLIHGGMLSGAMGGGIMICVIKQCDQFDSKMNSAINDMRAWEINESRPFQDLTRIFFRVNEKGMTDE